MKHFFQHIRLKYDEDTCYIIKEYNKNNHKLAKQQQRLKFLLKCKDYGITPPHLKGKTNRFMHGFKLDITRKAVQKIEKDFMMKILNVEIKETNIQIRNIRTTIWHIKKDLQNILEENELNSIIQKQEQYIRETRNITEKHLNNKIQTQIENSFEKFGLRTNEDWFINKTEINIPKEIRWLLSLGNKFALPITRKSFSPIHLIADIEQSIQMIEDERTKDTVRCNFATKINTYKNKLKCNPKEKLILKIYEDTKKFIHKYKDSIVITNADKGNKTVMMYKKDYNQKMKNLLNDKHTYKTIRIDPTQQLLRKNNKIVSEIYKQKNIDYQLKQQLTSTAATAPRLYGLPKIHKENTPLRPISSSVNVPCYKLSKFMGNKLKHLISEDLNVKNSFQFKDKLKKITIESDEILVSFDVVSLFTNIPIHLAIRTIMKQWPTLEKHMTTTKQQFQSALDFCLRDNNFFVYDGTYYQQVYGMPMGNPLSPTVADIVMDKILDDAIFELKSKDIYIKYINKYVDDIFAIIKKKDVDEILNTLNAQHVKIQFTIEKEKDEKLAFLDVEIHRKNNELKMNWYAKAIASCRIINFHSNHPWIQKKNTTMNLISKIYNLSDQEFMLENNKKIKNILYNNGYPNTLIQSLITTTTNQIIRAKEMTKTKEDNDNQIFRAVTYIEGLTDNKTMGKIIQQNNIRFAHRPHRTLNTVFTKTKDKIHKEQQHNVIYEIKCNGKEGDDCSRIYIGTTKRALGIRINEHKTDAKNKKETTALAQHLTKSEHTADFDNTRILDIENKARKRMTLEGLRIQQQIHCAMNFKEDVDNINCAYTTAITSNVRSAGRKGEH